MTDYRITYFEEDGSCNQKTLSGSTLVAIAEYLLSIGIVDVESIIRL